MLVLLVLGCWFARFAYLRITLEPTPRPGYWAEKIAALDPDPPHAVAFRDVLTELQDRPFDAPFTAATSSQPAMYPGDQTAILNGPWDDSRVDIAAATRVFQSTDFIDRRRAIIELSSKPWAIPAVATLRLNISHLSPFRQWAKWLVVHSRWSIEHANDRLAAIDDWLAVIRMSREISRHGLAIDHMTAAATILLASQEMTLIASKHATNFDCRRFAEAIDEACGPNLSAQQIFAAEHLHARSLLEHWYVREGGDWLAVNVAAQSNFGFGSPGRTPSAAWNLASPLFHDLPTAREDVDRTFERLGDCRDLVSSWRRLQDGEIEPRPSVLDGMVHWSKSGMARTALLCYRGRQSLEAAVAAIGIEQFRERYGEYPNRLEDLVPDFLPRLPMDYADRHPLRYRRVEDHYILYSIADNGVDDGGVIERRGTQAERQPRWERDVDYIFTDIKRLEIGK